MRRTLAVATLVTACGGRTPPEPVGAPPAYPEARRDAHVDHYFGTPVPDPYVWLEDLDADETLAWVQSQNELSRRVLDALPSRAAWQARLGELWRFERWSPPVRRGERWFWTFNDGTRDQPVLVVADAVEAPPRVLLDPSSWSDDGTVSLAEWVPSDDGRYVAYGVADAGSDWRTWRVVDVDTGAALDDELRWVKFSSASWLPDGSGFFYSRFPAPGSDAFEERLAHQKVWFHRVGTSQDADVLVHEEPSQPEWGFYARVTDDGRRLFVHVSHGTEEKSRQHYYDLDRLDLTAAGGRAGGELVRLLDRFDADYVLLGHEGDTAWFRTDLDAPRGRIVAVDVRRPEPEAWREVVPETEGTLASAALIGGRFVATYLVDARSELVVYEKDGTRAYQVTLPALGSVGWVAGEPDHDEAFFTFSSFTRPAEVWRLHVPTGEVSLVRRADLRFDPDAFVTEQVWLPSKDGTRVPMFLTFRKDLDRTRPHPTLLYGYGGFNIALTPGFRVDPLAWVERGGVYAVANLRGGGEFGRAWHLAGTKQAKQNVFDDFIAAAEWLVDEGWTTPPQLGVHGRSNGGLLVGAVLTQRPDLFGATVPSVGVLDMLKYHRWTIGWAWASDYGTSDESEAMFRYLLDYSPVHAAREGTRYPPTLVTTGDHDDRVVPAHSYKFAAALQHAQAGDAPILARIETRAGHGAQTPVSMLVEEAADVLAFLSEHLGLPVE